MTAISLIGAPLVAIGATWIAARGTALPIPLAAALACVTRVTAAIVFARRPWLMRRSADDDPAQVRDSLLRMAAIAERFPQITLVPAHDLRGFAGLPWL